EPGEHAAEPYSHSRGPYAPCLCVLALLSLGLRPARGGMDSCYDLQGRAQRCMPTFENTAFGREAQVTNTCGSLPEDYCLQMGARDATKLCHRCDAGDPLLHHNATYLTDFHSQEESTWWQSQSMAFGIQHPSSVNITLHLGKSYEITYVRLKFHTSRPESFAIYKRSRVDGPWIPYQYYSASCGKTYGKQERQYLRPGEDEQVAFCTEEFSDISPLSGGNVAFSTLEGRPSAYSFDESPVLQVLGSGLTPRPTPGGLHLN
uniref:Laminin subunit gamma 3 n=1 Tax=Pelusios castaneus TaxID=367368 RepID=A0A8C8S826_9SAUR